MPITTASYIGNVNSPANAQPTGNIGTIKIPIKIALAPTTYMLLVLNVPYPTARRAIEPKQITLKINKYFLYLSSKNPEKESLRLLKSQIILPEC